MNLNRIYKNLFKFYSNDSRINRPKNPGSFVDHLSCGHFDVIITYPQPGYIFMNYQPPYLLIKLRL